jgi:hypothetical protein
MTEEDEMPEGRDKADARPVPVPPAVHELIRKVAPERAERPAPKPVERPEPEPVDPEPSPATESGPAIVEREFTVDGEEWLARIVGEGAGGTGPGAVAYLVAIRFYPAGKPGEAAREALLPRGRFEMLYEEELIELFRTARPIPRD